MKHFGKKYLLISNFFSKELLQQGAGNQSIEILWYLAKNATRKTGNQFKGNECAKYLLQPM